MKFTKSNILVLTAVFALLCSSIFLLNQCLSYKPLQRYHFLHFGTIIQINTRSDATRLSSQAIESIDLLLKNLHFKWHPWRPGHLQQLNHQLESLQWFTTDEESVNMIKLSKKLYNKSLGHFNPAIGKLVAYWGFHQDNPEINNYNKNTFDLNIYLQSLPNPNHIKIIQEKFNLISTLTPSKNSITANTRFKLKNTNKNLKLDFSGFIKADAMLQIRNLLLNNNIIDAIINIGGDIYVMGTKSLNESWTIAVPDVNKNYIKLEINPNESIATSGVYARSRVDHNKLQHHIINPKTGQPSEGFYSATVIHHDPYLADAAATALIISNNDTYKDIAASMGVDKYILTDKNNKQIISATISSRLK